jgi:predicted Rdx family selenoprotein
MLKAVTLKEIERIFEILDAMNISREAVVIPLRPEHPGRVSIMKDGKLEIVVERDGDFEDWVNGLRARIDSLMNPEQD